MTLLTAIGFSLALLCPLHAFAFPSVSLFRLVCNPEWINSLRSDYPLNSASAESSYFRPLELEQSPRAPLPFRPMLLLGLRAKVSRAVASESCPDYAIPVWVECPCALPFRPKSSVKDTFRDDLLNGRTPISRTKLRRSDSAQAQPCSPSGKPFVRNLCDLVERLATTTAEPA